MPDEDWCPESDPLPMEIGAFVNHVLQSQNMQQEDLVASTANITQLRKIFRLYSLPYLPVGRNRKDWVTHWVDSMIAPLPP